MTSAAGRVSDADPVPEPLTGSTVWDQAVTATARQLLAELGSSVHGLVDAEAEARLAECGENRPERVADPGILRQAVAAVRSPFVGLLAGLGVVFTLLGDARGAVTVTAMVLLSVAVRWWQQVRSVRATARLRESVLLTVTVRRRADARSRSAAREVPVSEVVPGEVVELAAGDLVPADVRLLWARDLLVDQSGLSGESLPVVKCVPRPARRGDRRSTAVTERDELCFAGTSVVRGRGRGVVVATGAGTYLGSVARYSRAAGRPDTAFDQGVRSVGWTLITFMLVMAPVVLVLSGVLSGQWTRAVLFAVAVAVGLTPEMLPVIVTTSLARGAAALAARKVLVRRLNAVQDLAAVEVLCVDKTGTLTEDRVVYAHGVDVEGEFDASAVRYVRLALHFQAAPWDRLDEALHRRTSAERDHRDAPGEAPPGERLLEADELVLEALYGHVAEVGFDSYRRRVSVVLRETRASGPDTHLIITRGDPTAVLDRCTEGAVGEATMPLDPGRRRAVADLVRAHAEHGMRLLAVAVRRMPARRGPYDETDERDLTLVGFIGFVDPVRADAAEAVAVLHRGGVRVVMLTGDDEHVAAQVGRQVRLPPGRVVLGSDIQALAGRRARAAVTRNAVFARCTPADKTRIIALLRESGYAVGFLGDGLNDAPALRSADVGIAADTASDVAKDAADLILLDRSLTVLAEAVLEGRRTLANTLKYVYITAASNFGNVLSVLAASVWLPFLPMLPIQLMVQNLLYDAAQLALPFDRADPRFLQRPRRWDATGLVRFMAVFGPLSSVFDLATFVLLRGRFAAGPVLLQTGWFVEGLCTQLMVVLLLRTGAPIGCMGPRRAPTLPVVLAAVLSAGVGLVLPLSPLAGALGMRVLPVGYLGWLVLVIAGYGLSVEVVKRRYVRRRPIPW